LGISEAQTFSSPDLKNIDETLPKNLKDNNTNTTSITMENIQ